MKRYMENILAEADAAFIEFVGTGERPENPYSLENDPQANELWRNAFDAAVAEKNAWIDHQDKIDEVAREGAEAFDSGAGVLSGLQYKGSEFEAVFVRAYTKRSDEYAAYVEMQSNQAAWQNAHEMEA